MAADVVGYSRLMEQDEAGTLAALKERRKLILAPLVAEHEGRIVKVMGDGVLVEFASAVNAVACAVELQKRMATANGGVPEERQIVLRIGVNLGDVIVEGGDLYGDGVNIAARLQEMAEPGGICIAGGLHDQVEKKLALCYEDLGAREMKNLSKPVRIFRVSADEHTASASIQPPLSQSKPSIAVLPFSNMSGDPGQQYFSDGITEDIITELSRFRDLFVIARNSSFQYRDKAIDIKRVGRELGVQFVVEGSARKFADRVRISAQLVDAASSNHLWAERYDRDSADVFAVQEELAHAIAATVGSRVEAAGRDRAIRQSPASLTSYDLVLRAKALMLKFTRSAMDEARALALQAIEIDPTNARAHAHYAACCFNVSMAHWTAERERVFEEAFHHARRAVALDEFDNYARWYLGFMHLFRREYEDARIHIEKALESNPNDTEARINYGLYLTAIGQADAGIAQIDLAKRHNPFDLYWIPWLSVIAFFTARRYREAIAVLSQISEPINEIRGWLAASYAHAGQLAEAKASLDEFLRVAKRDMVVYPGDRLKDWEGYWHAAMEYRDQRDFDHLFDGLRKAGLPE
ncbi:MAG: adenylate/guanylate cyclase domain-containing protein [Rhodospirillales bacterium]|nr:adenylate/guanylate cyclase domain-containing protein [Rhodospirillales bacterium]